MKKYILVTLMFLLASCEALSGLSLTTEDQLMPEAVGSPEVVPFPPEYLPKELTESPNYSGKTFVLAPDELIKEGISYQVIGGVRFYERQEIKDVLAYLRASQSQEDSVSILRIINVPPRGIGKKTVEKILDVKKNRDFHPKNFLENHKVARA